MGYPNIIQQINSKLPLSGGTLTGAINFANNTWNTVGDDAYFGDCNIAGCVGIKGKNGETGVNFISKDGTTSSKLCISGSNLTINGNTIITSAGGELKGTLYTYSGVPYELRHQTASISDTTRESNSWQMLCVGLDRDGKRGGGIEVSYGIDGSRAMYFTLRNRNDDGYLSAGLREHSNGSSDFHVNGYPVNTLIAQWRSGVNGYRRYSDGYTEQWGRGSINERQALTVNLHIAMSTSEYMVIPINFAGSTAADAEGSLHISSTSTTSFVMTCGYINPNTSAMGWYVCGY